MILTIANRILEEFQNDGYVVAMDTLNSDSYDISITKGDVFKAVWGMKTALNVTLLPQGSNIHFEAGVGIWGQQIIPTVISMLFFWPVLITQIWGMVKQSKHEDKALDIAMNIVQMNNNYSHASTNNNRSKFFTGCGFKNTESANFCCRCGKAL